MKKITLFIIAILLISTVYAQQASRIVAKNKLGESYSNQECAELCGCDDGDPRLCPNRIFSGTCQNGMYVTVASCYLQCKNDPECFNKGLGDSCKTEEGKDGVCALAGNGVSAKPGRLSCDISKSSSQARDCELIQKNIDNSVMAQIGNIECEVPAYCQESVEFPFKEECDIDCNENGKKIVEIENGGVCEVYKEGVFERIFGEMQDIRRFFCYGESDPQDTENCVPPFGIYLRDLFNCLEGWSVPDGDGGTYTFGTSKRDVFTDKEVKIPVNKKTCEYLGSCMNVEGVEIKWKPETGEISCNYCEMCYLCNSERPQKNLKVVCGKFETVGEEYVSPEPCPEEKGWLCSIYPKELLCGTLFHSEACC